VRESVWEEEGLCLTHVQEQETTHFKESGWNLLESIAIKLRANVWIQQQTLGADAVWQTHSEHRDAVERCDLCGHRDKSTFCDLTRSDDMSVSVGGTVPGALAVSLTDTRFVFFRKLCCTTSPSSSVNDT
jgi:hypothetical protein